jgi:hypothetical protein
MLRPQTFLSREGTKGCVIPAKAGIQVCFYHQKPLDTFHQKSILIEDIVVDNTWEGLISDQFECLGTRQIV